MIDPITIDRAINKRRIHQQALEQEISILQAALQIMKSDNSESQQVKSDGSSQPKEWP